MGMATVYFSPDHNSAAISYDRSTVTDMPTDAVNHALATLYDSPGDLGPFIYEAWGPDGSDPTGKFLGLVVAEKFVGPNDEPFERIRREFNWIIESNTRLPEDGAYAQKEIPV